MARRQVYNQRGMVLQNDPTADPNARTGFAPADITNALSASAAAPGIGLGVPTGLGPTGVNTDISGLMPGATQGLGQQGALSNMLMQQAQGQGPNPAQMMLNQAAGRNAKQIGALMASARGAGSNPALIAKLAGEQGANIQQQAAGQAATLGAEQQLAAQQQLAGLSAQQVAQQQAANQQNVSMQGNINAANASLANTLIGNRGKEFGGVQQGFGTQNAINSQGTGSTTDKAMDAAYQRQSAADMGASGGGINAASGGMIGPRSLIGQHLAKLAMGGYARGGKVPALVSPGEIYLPPSKAKEVAKGKASPSEGQRIPGKAKVKGDSLKNDTVKKTLDEGGVVVPRSKANDYDKAAAFVKAVMAKNKKR